MNYFICSDDFAIYTDGLRYIEKQDRTWSGKDTQYLLEVAYKGSVKIHTFKTKEERDTFYEEILKYLRKDKNDSKI